MRLVCIVALNALDFANLFVCKDWVSDIGLAKFVCRDWVSEICLFAEIGCELLDLLSCMVGAFMKLVEN